MPVSAGELLDKITILQIKAQRIGDPAKRANVAVELAALEAVAARAGPAGPWLVLAFKFNLNFQDSEAGTRSFAALGGGAALDGLRKTLADAEGLRGDEDFVPHDEGRCS